LSDIRSDPSAKKALKKPQKSAFKTAFKPAPKKAIFCELLSDPQRSKSSQAQNGAMNPSSWNLTAPKNAYFIDKRNIYSIHKKTAFYGHFTEYLRNIYGRGVL
tara:strand:+ start:342 stop:650 length:309 start_codon:yes stop_codon:yes gene_type:complete